jgi:GDP-L-fucose synthase
MLKLDRNARIFVTGHRGLVGSALLRVLRAEGFENVLTATRSELDLRDQCQVDAWFETECPDYVIHAAGTVGGILANSQRPADFLYDNLMMHATVLRAAWQTHVSKLLYLGSSCIYPRDCPQPIREEYLLTGPLEATNDAYAIAKIAGVKACEAYRRQHGCQFISAMPTNLYGPGDNFDLTSSHVLPALMRRFHEAKLSGQREVVVWGSGSPRREFLHVDDLARGCLFLLEHYNEAQTINIGYGEDVSIRELSELVRDIVHPDGEIVFDQTKPDGTPRKLLDISRISSLGWGPRVALAAGIRETYRWFLENNGEVRGAGAVPAGTTTEASLSG